MSDHASPAEPSATFHFISGRPRSGGALLAAILRQNPRFHAGMTSPLADMLGALIAEMSGKNDFSVAVSDRQRADVLRAVVQSFHRQHREGDGVFDTSRGWCGKLPVPASLFPAARPIVCVREVPWILDSVERLVRSQAGTGQACEIQARMQYPRKHFATLASFDCEKARGLSARRILSSHIRSRTPRRAGYAVP